MHETNKLFDYVHSLVCQTTHADTLLSTEMNDHQFMNYWTLLDPQKTGKLYLKEIIEVIKTYDIWRHELNRKEEIEEMFTVNKESFRARVYSFVTHPNYELLLNLCAIGNFTTIYFKTFTTG